ncbi:hydantoinase/oxoprolinase family protein [Pseudomonas putida]|uniref:hydantoinase/oxoprolinase family protein n=1 Tax=Pseudomonas putida TaxID=303 RepID=UPI0023639783|nr:hydantoinase/oxoprolinase family protein [Pseudomonas putida]MDD2002071.1 hydantoinase/oxoprolinase family protein [Pseudomonas putida]
MNSDKARVGVDIGGTFTDVALEKDRVLYSTKVLTNYTSPESAIVEGIAIVLAQANIGFADLGSIIHGTTLATNALIERRGAQTAFITTKGFRDVIEMRTENRFELYDLDIVLPAALIERHDRYVVSERVGASGEVVLELDLAEVDRVILDIKEGGYESVAIGLMHSYLNPTHEIAIRERVKALAPELSVSISSEVSPQIREFQRFNTVCANAYVKPLMSSYLNRLVGRLKSEGALCPVFMIHSGGGIITVESAAEFPVRLLESGPAGGAIFAATIARQYGLDQVISYDMGGTTAKICLIDDQTPKTAKTFEVARTYRFKKGSGMPISIPVIEMVEIGAGGGSIASVDSMRQIRVGPHSAGSEPGPACYGRGGAKPTVSDADLILGRLDADNFAGGAMKLSTSSALGAIETEIGATLGINNEAAAFGICEVVDESMSNAARMHAVENGKELSEYTMIAFGGAAPLHASRLCEKLGIKNLIIPPGAGVGSAIGFLRAPIAFESVRSAYTRFDRFDAVKINAVVTELKDEATRFVLAADANAKISLELTAYVRYVGQGWEIPVAVPVKTYSAEDKSLLKDAFEQAYTNFFGRAIDGLDAEIISWSLRASSPVQDVTRSQWAETTQPVHASKFREAFDAQRGEFVTAVVVERSELTAGSRVSGPAIIAERETTTIVSSSYDAIMQNDGCILVQAKG